MGVWDQDWYYWYEYEIKVVRSFEFHSIRDGRSDSKR